MLPTTFESHGGRRLRTARVGQGPPLVLLHGYPDNLQIWSRLAQLLSGSFEVIAFDWPGMGYSEAWPGGATPFHMADHLLALLDAWKIEKAVVAGIDMGGQPAMALASRHPKRVRGVVVMNSLLQWDAPTSWDINLLRRYGWNRFALRSFPRLVFNRAIHTFVPPKGQIDPDVMSDMWESFRKPNVRDFIVRMCAGYQGTLPQLAKEYRSIQAPVLLLWAEHEKHFPIEHASRVQGVLPTAHVEIISKASHWMPLFTPEVIAHHILTGTFSPSSESVDSKKFTL